MHYDLWWWTTVNLTKLQLLSLLMWQMDHHRFWHFGYVAIYMVNVNWYGGLFLISIGKEDLNYLILQGENSNTHPFYCPKVMSAFLLSVTIYSVEMLMILSFHKTSFWATMLIVPYYNALINRLSGSECPGKIHNMPEGTHVPYKIQILATNVHNVYKNPIIRYMLWNPCTAKG